MLRQQIAIKVVYTGIQCGDYVKYNMQSKPGVLHAGATDSIYTTNSHILCPMLGQAVTAFPFLSMLKVAEQQVKVSRVWPKWVYASDAFATVTMASA